jgi:hypothetical protein
VPALPAAMSDGVDTISGQETTDAMQYGTADAVVEREQPAAPDKRVLDRTARQRKLSRLKISVAIAGLAGMGLFSGLAVANTHASSSHAVTPDQQINSLENAQGGGFFSSGGNGLAPPSNGGGAPQTSSGGS